MNKELVIKCIINKSSNNVAIIKNGFDSESVEDALTIIGMLENIKSLELERIKTVQQNQIDIKKNRIGGDDK